MKYALSSVRIESRQHILVAAAEARFARPKREIVVIKKAPITTERTNNLMPRVKNSVEAPKGCIHGIGTACYTCSKVVLRKAPLCAACRRGPNQNTEQGSCARCEAVLNRRVAMAIANGRDDRPKAAPDNPDALIVRRMSDRRGERMGDMHTQWHTTADRPKALPSPRVVVIGIK